MFERLRNSFSGIRKYFFGEGGGQFWMSQMSEWTKRRSRKQMLEEYRNLVHQCVSTLGMTVGRYQPVIGRKGPTGQIVPMQSHPFMSLLERPNPDMTMYDLFEATTIFKHLSGDAYWYVALGEISRKPKELYLIRPDRVRVACDNDGQVIGYVVRQDDGTDIPLEIDEVIHHKFFNPINPYYGLGTVQANLLYIDTENSTSMFQYSYMKNQATPSGVLSFKGGVKKEAFEKIKTKWREQQAGEKNAGKTLLIREADANFTAVGLSLADLDLAGLKKLTDEKVRNAFKVPKAMLGETDENGLGRANVEAIEYVFAKYTIDPDQDKLDDTLTMAMRRYFPTEQLTITHVSQVPEDKEFELKKLETGVGKWITRNEARIAEGKPAMDGGDQLYIGFNEVPINEAAPTNANNTGKTIKVSLKKKSQPVVKTAEETFFNALMRNEALTERQYKKELKSLLDEQEVIVISRLAAHGNKSQKELLKAFEDITPDEETTARNWIERLVAFLFASIDRSGPIALRFLNVDGQVNFVITQGARDHIFNSGQRLLKSFNVDTTTKIQKTLIDGVNNHESLAELTTRVESVYSDAKGYRAARIANTEGHKASNFGVHEAYRSAGIKKMVWQANPDACEFCQAMDGQEADIGGVFLSKGTTVEGVDGGEYLADYADVQLADLHPNCRCIIIPVFED